MKILYFTLIFFFLSLSFVYAEVVDVDFSKGNYLVGETVLAEINFNYELSSVLRNNNFKLTDSDDNAKSATFYLVRVNQQRYFLYFDLPTSLDVGTYKLKADFLYRESGINKAGVILQQFSVNSGDNVLSVNPAGIFTDDAKNDNLFYIHLKSKEGSFDVSLYSTDSFVEISDEQISLNSGQDKTIQVFIDEDKLDNGTNDAEVILDYPGGGNKIFVAALYPIFIDEPGNDSEIINDTNTTEIINDTNVTLVVPIDAIRIIEDASMIDLNLSSNNSIEGYLRYKNFWNESVTDLTFSLLGNINEVIELKFNTVDEIESEEVLMQFIWVNKEKDVLPGYYSGEIVLSNEDFIVKFPVYVNLFEEEEIVENVELIPNQTLEDFNFSNGDLPPIEEKSNTLFFVIIGAIVVFLVIFFVFLYKKKGVKKQEFGEFIKKFEKK